MKNFIRLMPVLLLLLISIFTLTNCNGDSEETIKIGATLDFTGPNAVYGEQVREGIDLAVSEINQSGGVNGKPIEILFQDSKSNPSEAVSNANRFISIHGVEVIIGEISSNATIALVSVAEDNDVFLFAPASSSPDLAHISENFARNWPSGNAEAGSAAEFAFNHQGHQTATILYVNSYYGQGLNRTFRNVFESEGGEVISSESFEVDESNFRQILSRVRSQQPDVVYLAGNPREMGRAILQMRELGIETPVISNTGFLQSDCLSIAGIAADGVIVPTPSYSPSDAEEGKIRTFYQNFRSEYDKTPSLIHANSYDSIYLIAEAIEEVGYDGVSIADYLRNKKDFDGAAGLVSFTDGEVEVPITFKIIENGEPRTYLEN